MLVLFVRRKQRQAAHCTFQDLGKMLMVDSGFESGRGSDANKGSENNCGDLHIDIL